MKRTLTLICVAVLLFTAAVMMTSCSQWANQYDLLDKEGSTVSVKFDANGGMFAGTNGVTVVDVFNLNNYETDANGNKSISVIAPDDTNRKHNAFEISKSGYLLAGWFYETTDENGTTVSKKWDFANDKLILDANKTYSSSEPTLTLKAVWMSAVTFEFYEKTESGFELLGTKESTYIDLPVWDLQTGRLSYNNFLEVDGKTFESAYLDEAMTNPVTARIEGEFDYATGTNLTPVIKIYTTWLKGEWFKVSDVSHLTKNASKSGCYEILADIDFSGAIWPAAFVNNTFSGTIKGGGHTISGITATASVTRGGDISHGAIFGGLAANAEISDITFANVTYTIKSAAKATSANFGLFAGSNLGATLNNVSITNSKILVTENFGEDFSGMIVSNAFKVGLIFANSTAEHSIDFSGVSCEIALNSEDTPADFEITVNANGIVEFTYES